jgi:hypothetical protein
VAVGRQGLVSNDGLPDLCCGHSVGLRIRLIISGLVLVLILLRVVGRCLRRPRLLRRLRGMQSTCTA